MTKPLPAPLTAAELDALSDAELFAYRKRTGYLDDIRFSIRVLPPFYAECMAQLLADALARRLTKADTIREYCAIQNAWRRDKHPHSVQIREVA